MLREPWGREQACQQQGKKKDPPSQQLHRGYPGDRANNWRGEQCILIKPLQETRGGNQVNCMEQEQEIKSVQCLDGGGSHPPLLSKTRPPGWVWGQRGRSRACIAGAWGHCSAVLKGLSAQSCGVAAGRARPWDTSWEPIGMRQRSGQGDTIALSYPMSLIQAPASPRAPPTARRAGRRQQPQLLCSIITPTTLNVPLISTSTALCPPPEQQEATSPPPSAHISQAVIPHSSVPNEEPHWGHGSGCQEQNHPRAGCTRSASAASLHPHSTVTKTHSRRQPGAQPGCERAGQITAIKRRKRHVDFQFHKPQDASDVCACMGKGGGGRNVLQPRCAKRFVFWLAQAVPAGSGCHQAWTGCPQPLQHEDVWFCAPLGNESFRAAEVESFWFSFAAAREGQEGTH